ncbi:uncharacterized protein QC764_704040 [Podospora pseudoanserina]|uniref:DUF676 domain-containing protein n=1 Tax=Podospora pseudoanserina TaxID=2609844 RepID=A0ABR0HIH1_9PEZI|nr:hypothetical protein QC764_704040 [Podospora pseudoanserina]
MTTSIYRPRQEEKDLDDSGGSAIKVLHPKKEPTARVQADVVLVPGLGGHFIKTWQAKDELKTVWPSDLLPDYVTEIRVLSFQYNTSLNGTMSMLGITEHANDLLNWLYNNREDDEPATLRPIIFVGHSLGGMIIKRALYVARFVQQRYRGIWEASRGVMFFATPHHGLDRNTWRDFARFVLQHDAPVKGAMPTRTMVQQLEENCDNLRDITEDFKPLYDSLAFVTFVEEEPMPGLKHVLVNGLYGKMHHGHERHDMLAGNHLTICQFTREETGAFRLVWDGVEFLKKDKPNALDMAGYFAKRALYSLSSDKFHAYFLGRPHTPGTGDWIKERLEFQYWCKGEAGNGKLWIHGPAGSGKSFLTKHIITHILQPNNIVRSDSTVPHERQEVVHCFLSNMYASRNNIDALLQSTLHQALRLQPQIIKEFLLPTFEDAQSRERSKESVWTAERLVELWPIAMARVIMGYQHTMTLVVDGLDEIPSDEQTAFLQCIKKLDQGLGQSKQLRLLVVSQHNSTIQKHIQSLGINDCPIQQGDNEADIMRSIRGLLTHLLEKVAPGDEDFKTRVLGDIKGNRVDDSYLRSILRSEELKRTRVKDKDDILKALKEIPDGTQHLCDRHSDRLLNSYDPDTSRFIKNVLTWAAFQEDALNITELNTALAVAEAMRKFPGAVITEKQLADCLDENLKAKVDFYCGPLVNFADGRLSSLHRTAKSHIATKLETIEKNPEEPTPQGLLASSCTMYLSMQEAEQPAGESSETSWESRIRKTLRDRPFMRYASLYWHKHYHQAGEDVDADTQRQKELLTQEGDSRAKSWTEVWWFMRRGSEQAFPEEDLRLADKIVNSPPDNVGGGDTQVSGSLPPRHQTTRRQADTSGCTLPPHERSGHIKRASWKEDKIRLQSSQPMIIIEREIIEVEREVVKEVPVEKQVVKEVVKEVKVDVVREVKVVVVREVPRDVDKVVTKPEVQQIDKKTRSYFGNIKKAVISVGTSHHSPDDFVWPKLTRISQARQSEARILTLTEIRLLLMTYIPTDTRNATDMS